MYEQDIYKLIEKGFFWLKESDFDNLLSISHYYLWFTISIYCFYINMRTLFID